MSASLDEDVERFQPKHSQARLLHEHADVVRCLRSKGATSAEIETILNRHGIQVSEASIRRFLRRQQAPPKTPGGDDAVPPPPKPASAPSPKIRDLRGPV